jgi:hypothetical protein
MIWALIVGGFMLISLTILLLFCDLATIKNHPLSTPWLDNFIDTAIKPLTDIDKLTKIDKPSVILGSLLFLIFMWLNDVLILGAKRRVIAIFIACIPIYIILLAIVSIVFQITEYIKFSLAQFSKVLLGLLALEVFVGLQVAIILGFDKMQRLENIPKEPNYGIKKTFNNTMKLLLICGVISGLISALSWRMYVSRPEIIWWIFYRNKDSHGFIDFGFIVGLMVGLLSAMVNGENSGLVLIKHTILRLIFWCNGHTPCPWKYADFLDQAAGYDKKKKNHSEKPALLQKFGGSYQFKHRRFLEYLNRLNNE